MEKLVKQLATGANALMVADVAKLREAPIAIRENWFDTPVSRIQSGIEKCCTDENRFSICRLLLVFDL